MRVVQVRSKFDSCTLDRPEAASFRGWLDQPHTPHIDDLTPRFVVVDPAAASFRLQLEHVRATPKVPEWEQIAAKVWERLEPVARGTRDLDAALAALDADVDAILVKRRWLLDREAAEGKP